MWKLKNPRELNQKYEFVWLAPFVFWILISAAREATCQATLLLPVGSFVPLLFQGWQLLVTLELMFSYTMWGGCTKNVLKITNVALPYIYIFFLILAVNHSNCTFKVICARKQPVSRVWKIFGDLLLEVKEDSVFFHHANRQQIITRHPTPCKQKFSTHSKLKLSVALPLELCFG